MGGVAATTTCHLDIVDGLRGGLGRRMRTWETWVCGGTGGERAEAVGRKGK
jgi:hypothetical protein